jgi:5-methylcytosine-specific restriction endonuclease McrA
VSQIEVAIIGLAALRDRGEIVWLPAKQKCTTRALYNSRSGATQMFELATAEYWRAAKRTPRRQSFQNIREIMVHLGRQDDTYRDYMNSAAWRERRLLFIAKVGKHCHRCKQIGGELEVHHLRYDNLGHEPDEDLELLCLECHKLADAERSGRNG